MAELVEVAYNPFKPGGTPEDFKARYGSAAEKAGKALGVDPAVLLGQWGLETGWGKSVIPGTNNLGNIKDFAGGGVAATDNINGSKDKYRAYESPEAFADDFTGLIQRKYPAAVGAKDPLSFAKALKDGGYAEDPRYVDKVVQASRMAGTQQNPVMKAVGKAVESVIPSANAAEPQLVPVDFNPFAKAEEKPQPSVGERIVGGAVKGAKDLVGGLVRGAGSIGSTLLAPGDAIQDAIAGRPLMTTNNARRAGIDGGLKELGADPTSFNYGAGKLTSEVAGTLGVGNALGATAQAAGAAPKFVNALQSGGLNLGGAPATSIGEGVTNALTRAAGGAATGAASSGLVNPEDAKTGAILGGAIPAVAQVANIAGRTVGNRLADRAAEQATRYNRNAPLNQTLQDGIEAGYVVPPSSVRPSLYNTVKESVGGKIATAQVASTRNQEVTDRLVRQALGLADDAPLSVEALRAYRTAQSQAGYEPLRNLGMVRADQQFDRELTNIIRDNTGRGTIPAIANNEVANLVNAHRTGGFDAGDAIDAMRHLRETAADAFRNGNTAVGRANRAVSDAYEAAIERAIPQNQPQLLEAFRQARANMARSFTVEEALKEGTGAVDARKLASALQGGTPLDGELLTAARFASAFPKATQPPSLVGGAAVHNLKAGASGLGGATGFIAGGPVGAAAMAVAPWVVPPAVRAQMFSRGAQNRLIPQAPQVNRLAQLAQQGIDPDVQRLLARSAPVSGNALIPRVEVRGTSAD